MVRKKLRKILQLQTNHQLRQKMIKISQLHLLQKSRALSIASFAFGLSSGVTGVFSTSSLPFVTPEDKPKAKEAIDKALEDKVKKIDENPNLTPEQKEKAKEEARKEAEKVKKSIEEGKTTEWVDEKGNPFVTVPTSS